MKARVELDCINSWVSTESIWELVQNKLQKYCSSVEPQHQCAIINYLKSELSFIQFIDFFGFLKIFSGQSGHQIVAKP